MSAQAQAAAGAVASAVVIVTSDGYEAQGLALDPLSAAADYTLLDEFTRFLEKRVVTFNLALLRRMMAEYLCHCETTVHEYIAQGGPQIAIGPVGIAAESDREEAQRLLSQPHSNVRAGSSALVVSFLVTKLRTVRSVLLMRLFVEFCHGKDTALCEFVAKPEGFVTILPLAALHADSEAFSAEDGILFTSQEPQFMPAAPSSRVVTPKANASSRKQQAAIQPANTKHKSLSTDQLEIWTRDEEEHQQLDEELVSDMDSESSTDDPDTLRRSCLNRPDENLLKFKAKLAQTVETYEKQKPWLRVFNDQLPLPFNEHGHEELAKRLRAFWTHYSRVVWERNFWRPLNDAIDPKAYARRRARQRNAAIVFEKLMISCYEELGPKFFYRLDRHRHPGWWYRPICTNLLGLTTLVGYDKCLEYVEMQQYERFPDCGFPLPLKSANAGVVQRQYKERILSMAMWVQSNRSVYKEMKSDFKTYVAAKKRKKHARKAAKKASKLAAAHVDA